MIKELGEFKKGLEVFGIEKRLQYLEEKPTIIQSIKGSSEATSNKNNSFTFTLPAIANAKAWLKIPYTCTITGYDITADASGSCVLDLWNDSYANFPPTVADTITASAKPTLNSAIKNTSTTLTGWTTALAEGGYLLCNVDSASGSTIINLTLSVTRT